MSEMAFEELSMEYRALQLVAILVEEKLNLEPRPKGLLASEIKEKMNDRLSLHNCSDDAIRTLIDKIDNRWIYDRNNPLRGFRHIVTADDKKDGRKTRYWISDEIDISMWNQLLRVAICLALLRHGCFERIEVDNPLSESKEKDFLSVMNLVTSLENNRSIRIMRDTAGDRSEKIKPSTISIGLSAFVHYTKGTEKNKKGLHELIAGGITLN